MAVAKDLRFENGLVVQQLGVLADDAVKAAIAKVEAITEPVDDDHDDIAKDVGLSPIGKTQKLEARVSRAVEDIAAWRTTHVANGVLTKIAAVEKKLVAADETAHPVTAAEIDAMRLQLSAFDPSEALSLYASATDSERRRIELAAAGGRRPVKGPNGELRWEALLDIQQEPVRELIDQRQARVAPELASQLHNLRRLRTAYDGIAGSATALLKALRVA
jgi:hypothetical protein